MPFKEADLCRGLSWVLDRGCAELLRTASRNCPKRGTSNAPTVDLAGIRRPKWSEKPLLGGPQGYAEGVWEAFRTVSRRCSQKSPFYDVLTLSSARSTPLTYYHPTRRGSGSHIVL